MAIDIPALQAATAKLIADAAALQALLGETPPPPPPPPDSSVVMAPAVTVLTDAAGNTFKFGSPMVDLGSTIWGYFITVNSSTGQGPAVLMTLVGGVLFAMNSLGQWLAYRSNAFHAEVPSPVPNITSSDDKTTNDVGPALIDKNQKVFLFWSHLDPLYGSSIMVNGQQQGNIGTMKLTIQSGVIQSTDAQGHIKHWDGSQWA